LLSEKSESGKEAEEVGEEEDEDEVKAGAVFATLESAEELRKRYPLAGKAFAVVHVGGHQYKVTPGDLIITEKLLGAEVGSHIHLNKILLVGTQSATAVGTPLLEHAKIVAEVEEQTKAEKIFVFKKKRRKYYKRTRGHRQPITVLRIENIVYDELVQSL
jgi:large subunit ribosomal protein L21